MNRMVRNHQERCQQQQQPQQQNSRGYNNRIYQNRQQNLNQQYQNADFVRIIRVLNRNRELQECEENIYERLDDDEDDNENNDNNGFAGENNAVEINEVDRNETNNGDHTYERIDNRPWYRGNINARAGNYNNTNNFSAATSSSSASAILWNANRYDNPRELYLSNHDCFNNRFDGLSRNCFSTDNVALATNGRYVYHLGHNCMCQLCTRLPFIRYHICQRCNSFHDRLRCYDSGNPTGSLSGNARHYIYQVSRSCRCSYCRGQYSYPRFPISTNHFIDTLRHGDCQCKNTTNCNCRNRILSNSNPAIYIGRVGLVQSVNNPLYANPTLYVGRVERPSCSVSQESGAIASSSGGIDVNVGEASTSSASQSNTSAPSADTGPSTEQRINPNQAGPSNVLVLPVNNIIGRHTCDDSCMRNHPNNVGNGSGGICQLNRVERSDCHSSSNISGNSTGGGRISYHWWFVNRWLPPWGSQNDRNSDIVPRAEDPRDPPGSDSDEGLN